MKRLLDSFLSSVTAVVHAHLFEPAHVFDTHQKKAMPFAKTTTGESVSTTATLFGADGSKSRQALAVKKERAMSDVRVAPETKGVTVELLATVDLAPEIEGMAGRQLRMRKVTIEPGGVFGPVHDHKDRPGTVYILQGTITDHRNGVATDYGPGVGWPEDRNTTHWLENRGTLPAVEISVDIVRQE